KDENHSRLVSYPGGPRGSAGVGRQRQPSYRAQEADAICQSLLVSYPRSRLGTHHHQDQRASSIPCPSDAERSRIRGLSSEQSWDRFTKEGNCFTRISDAAGLAKIADT